MSRREILQTAVGSPVAAAAAPLLEAAKADEPAKIGRAPCSERVREIREMTLMQDLWAAVADCHTVGPDGSELRICSIASVDGLLDPSFGIIPKDCFVTDETKFYFAEGKQIWRITGMPAYIRDEVVFDPSKFRPLGQPEGALEPVDGGFAFRLKFEKVK